MELTYVGHATVLMEIDGVRLLTDPLLRNRVGHLRRQATAVSPSCYHNVDAVLISHLHWDHLDLASLRLLGRETRLIVPFGTSRLLRRYGYRRIEEMRIGETVRVKSIQITSTYADHNGARLPWGRAVDSLGFLVRGSYQVYFAGDTDLFPEMAALSDSLDVALLPVWGWGPTLRGGHLDPYRAAQAVNLLRPRLVIPIHWGTFLPLGMAWLRPRFLRQPPYAFKEHAVQLAPDVVVQIVEPGRPLSIRKSLAGL